MSAGSVISSYYAGVFFSAIITTVFYGFTCMQTFFYYVHYRDDTLYLKVFIMVIWALNTSHEALTVSGSYQSITGGFVSPPSLLDGIPELTVLPTALVAVLTQGFLMHRIYIFNGRKIVMLLVWLALGIFQLVFSTLYVAQTLNGIASARVDEITVVDKTLTITLTLSLSLAAGVDILIAIILVFLLVRQREPDLFSSTLHMLQRLTVLAVNTGTWTAVFALLSLLFLYVVPSENLYTVFGIPLCPVYCNTLLANLNARAFLRDRSTGRQINASVISLASSPPNGNGQHRETKPVFSPPEAFPRTMVLAPPSSDTNLEPTRPEDV